MREVGPVLGDSPGYGFRATPVPLSATTVHAPRGGKSSAATMPVAPESGSGALFAGTPLAGHDVVPY